ncbi:hypothetical protein AAFF_G00347900 [Aldrovandia affinis]|uniref:Uncharacterized protein n=1 Tax=Aldrovandia affinis TaxID=143900 RepID=A0AAD7SJQ7_9TELE|nr:hypothetical protein AAFF_G00347900 [Aldrovandia affinis]
MSTVLIVRGGAGGVGDGLRDEVLIGGSLSGSHPALVPETDRPDGCQAVTVQRDRWGQAVLPAVWVVERRYPPSVYAPTSPGRGAAANTTQQAERNGRAHELFTQRSVIHQTGLHGGRARYRSPRRS